MLIKIAEGFETFHNRSADISVAVLSALIIVLPFLLTYAITNVSSYLSIKNGTEGQEPPSIPYAIPFLGNISLSLNTLKFLNFLTFVAKYLNFADLANNSPERIFMESLFVSKLEILSSISFLERIIS
jgi:hypothetical protein